MAGDGSEFPERCDYCGRSFGAGVRYPTVTGENGNGTIHIYTFCDETCKSRWIAENER